MQQNEQGSCLNWFRHATCSFLCGTVMHLHKMYHVEKYNQYTLINLRCWLTQLRWNKREMMDATQNSYFTRFFVLSRAKHHRWGILQYSLAVWATLKSGRNGPWKPEETLVAFASCLVAIFLPHVSGWRTAQVSARWRWRISCWLLKHAI